MFRVVVSTVGGLVKPGDLAIKEGGRLGFTHLDGRGQMARWTYLGA